MLHFVGMGWGGGEIEAGHLRSVVYEVLLEERDAWAKSAGRIGSKGQGGSRDEEILLAFAKPEDIKQHNDVTEGQKVGKVGVAPSRK